MNSLPPGELSDCWNPQSYSVKVRGLKYLWGSAKLTKNLKFDKPFILHIANDLAGEPVKIGFQLASGTKTDLGVVEPGERVSISVNDMSGVFADCVSESLVYCLIY